MTDHADLTRKETFSAAHHYRMSRFSREEAERIYGTAAIHGHNYALETTVRGPVSKRTGMVENLSVVKKVVRRAIGGLNEKLLNEEVERFREEPPTLENLCAYLWERLDPFFPGGILFRIKLAEDETIYAERERGRRDVFLTRAYHFSAAHRLHEPALSDEENREIFGLCNNPSGHGHNYEVEVTVRGEVDPATGTIVNVPEMDRKVMDRVVDYLDHTHLNLDVPEFRDLNPTAENIARVMWERLEGKLGGARIHRIRLYESPRNIVEYFGPGGEE